MLSKQRNELVHRQAGLTDQSPQSSFPKLFVIRDRQAAMRGFRLSQYDVTSTLTVDLVSYPAERLYCLASRDDWQLRHP